MVKAPTNLKPAVMLRDSVHVWDEKKLEWFPAWEGRFNRRFKHKFFDKLLETSTDPQYSNSFYCAPYRNALVMYNINYESDNSQTIHIEPEFSWDNVQWFPCWLDWWGFDQIVSAMMPHIDCMPIPILAPYIRFKYTCAAVEAQSELNIKIEAIFNSR